MKFYSGLPETRCGRGSTLEATKEIRASLPRLLRDIGVKSIVDAPCGDHNWMSQIELPGIEYTGLDIDEENIRLAIDRSNRRFVQQDIIERLPSADLLLCREFLQHVTNEDVTKFLAHKSKFEWLLITNHDNEENSDIRRGDFREVNLTKAPFNLPKPLLTLADSEKTLALWHVS